MKKHTSRPRLIMCLLDERYYCEAPGSPVVCRLWRMRPAPPVEGSAVFAIGMENPAKRYLYCVGDDPAAARSLFETVTEEKLSPVHLGDVIEDFSWELRHNREESGNWSAREADAAETSV